MFCKENYLTEKQRKNSIKVTTLSRVKTIKNKPADDGTSRSTYQCKYTSYQVFSIEEATLNNYIEKSS